MGMRTRDQVNGAKVCDVPAAHFARFYIRQCSSNILWSVPHNWDVLVVKEGVWMGEIQT